MPEVIYVRANLFVKQISEHEYVKYKEQQQNNSKLNSNCQYNKELDIKIANASIR
jgi:hypothetical protein